MATEVAALTGDEDLPVEPYPGLDAMADRFELSMVSHSPARFDPGELETLNARLLHAMSYEVARPRLAALGLDDEALWLGLRGNLTIFGDIVDLAHLVRGPVTPEIAPDDRGFITLAGELLPNEPWDSATFSAWTGALKEKSGRKGKPLFEPLRLALTGHHDGPDLKSHAAADRTQTERSAVSAPSPDVPGSRVGGA